MRCALATAAFLIALGAVPCPGDTITLRDGRKLVGKIVSEEGDEIRVILRYGEVTLPKSDVVSLEKGPTPEEVYRDRAAAVGEDDLEGLVGLARWCRENDLDRESRWEFGRVLEIDRDHAEARKALGFVLHEGEWITGAEHREITRYPWVRETRKRLEEKKVTLEFTRTSLPEILVALARQTEEEFRLLSAPKLERLKMTYHCKDRPAADVLEDIVRNVSDLDYVFTKEAVVIGGRKDARKIRRRYGMPSPSRQKTAKEVRGALQARHLTLLFVKKPLSWVLQYLEALSGVGIVLDAPEPAEPLSYQCTAKPLGQILADLLSSRGLRYEIVGASVVVRK